MANTIDRQVLVSGNGHYVIKFTAVSDGAAGDLSAVRVNSVSGDLGLTPKIEKLSVSTNSCGATLFWDATTTVPFMSCPADAQVEVDLVNCYANITDNGATGKTGDIKITTTGMTTANDSITVVLYIKTTNP